MKNGNLVKIYQTFTYRLKYALKDWWAYYHTDTKEKDTSNSKFWFIIATTKTSQKSKWTTQPLPTPDNKFLGNNLWASSIVSKHGCKKSNLSGICIFYSRMIYAHSSIIYFNFRLSHDSTKFQNNKLPPKLLIWMFCGGLIGHCIHIIPKKHMKDQFPNYYPLTSKLLNLVKKRKA